MISTERFAKWVEAFEARDAPLTQLLPIPWGRPPYARPTLTERVEPYYTQWRESSWELPYECDECGAPDPEFYTPTPKLLALERRVDALAAKAFREVPNPDYDPVRAAEWEERRFNRFNQTQYVVGQRYSPTPE